MRNYLLAIITTLTFGTIAQAKVTTAISGEEALAFAFASVELGQLLGDIDGGNLVAVKLTETGKNGDISDYRHIVKFDYYKEVKTICEIKIAVGLKTTTHGRPRITTSEKYIDSAANDINCRKSK